MITFENCLNIYLACQADKKLFKCENCPCNTINFRNGDFMTDMCNSLYSLQKSFNKKTTNGE